MKRRHRKHDANGSMMKRSPSAPGRGGIVANRLSDRTIVGSWELPARDLPVIAACCERSNRPHRWLPLPFHEPSPGARTADSARSGNRQHADSAVHAPAADRFLVPKRGFEIVEAPPEPERRSPDRLDCHFYRNEPIGRSARRSFRGPNREPRRLVESLSRGEGWGEDERKIKVVFAYTLVAALIMLSNSVLAGNLPADWQKEQRLEIPAPGLTKISLPVETLDAARAALEDLRLYDDAGNELPYFLERPVPASKLTQGARSFRAALNANNTVITFDTGLTLPVDAVTLETPATSFIKPVQMEGTTDGRAWRSLAEGQPVFRLANGASQLRLTLPSEPWRSLRLTVDDRRSPPIPFTGARLHAAEAAPTPGEVFPVTIAGRHENPGETRFTLNLGAANLDLASLRLETDEPLFQRQVTLAVPQVVEDSIREQVIGQDTIYRVALDGQPAGASLTVALESRVRSRELFVRIQNDDSPPLTIKAVTAERRPVYLVFLARAAGTHHLLTGNPRCAAPRYDLATLGGSLTNANLIPIRLAAPADNPAYRAPEALAEVELTGAALDVSRWQYRKAIKLLHGGAQQLELDLEVLAHAQPDFADLRLMRGGRQAPYVLERTSITRVLTPTVTATNDARDLKRSWWTIQLPQPRLPLTRLSCTSHAALFERTVMLFEDITDERGERQRHQLGNATWVRTPEQRGQELVLRFDSPPQTDTLLLTTDNGDNPAIELENVRVFHPATRILFKAKADDDLVLYYGQPDAAPPRYDLSLVAHQLLMAEKSPAALIAEQRLKKAAWGQSRTGGKGGVVFWGMLAVVVVGLLFVIARLLPKAPPAS